jgi:chromosome segregation ATPase
MVEPTAEEVRRVEELRRAHQDGMRQGEMNAKLDLLLSAQDDIRKMVGSLSAQITPVQQDAQRALDGLSKAAADILETKARTSRMEENRAKVTDMEALEKRLQIAEDKMATFEGRAAIITIAVGAMCALMGGVVGFVIQELLVVTR